MEVVDDGAAAEVEEVLAGATVSSTSSLPAADMSQGVLDWDPLPQFGSAVGCELPLARLLEESFIRMNVDTAAGGTGGAAVPQGTDLALILREVDGLTELKGDAHLVRTTDGAGLPVERKGRFGIPVAVADGPRFGIDHEIRGAIPDELTGQ